MESQANYDGTWVVLPTYNEIENLPRVAPAILAALPGATLSSSTTRRPTARASWPTRWRPTIPMCRVMHRTAKQGLGKAYIAGFQAALEQGAQRIVQMDADWLARPQVPALARRQPGQVRPGASARAMSRAAGYATGA